MKANERGKTIPPTPQPEGELECLVKVSSAHKSEPDLCLVVDSGDRLFIGVDEDHDDWKLVSTREALQWLLDQNSQDSEWDPAMLFGYLLKFGVPQEAAASARD